MARPAGPGRRALVEAGLAVAEERGLAGLSVNAVVESAGMAKGSFYQHFSDRSEFLRILHRRYHDELEAKMVASVEGMEPGTERLRTMVEGFLDMCLETRGTKAFIVQSRTEGGLLDEVQARNARAAVILAPDLVALGWDPPEPAAHLVVAMAADVSLQELFDHRPRRDLRDQLMRFAAGR